jgi:hypothetical protein
VGLVASVMFCLLSGWLHDCLRFVGVRREPENRAQI